MNPNLFKAKLEFLVSLDAQDLVLKNLERAAQICVDVANHPLARWPWRFAAILKKLKNNRSPHA